MALTITDGTRQETLDLLSERLGGIPIKYARIFSRYVTRDNHPAGAFEVMLACYVTDAPAPDAKTPLNTGIGVAPLPESALADMAATDDRAVLYRYVEWLLHYQAAEARRGDDGFDAAAENTALTALAEELGIEPPVEV